MEFLLSFSQPMGVLCRYMYFDKINIAFLLVIIKGATDIRFVVNHL